MSFEEDLKEKNLVVTTRTRPVRLAFLINEASYSAEALDEVIAFCLSNWSGRYAPIVQIEDPIDPATWRFLRENDPDIIVSLFEISDSLLERINREILPIRVVEAICKPEDRDWLSQIRIPAFSINGVLAMASPTNDLGQDLEYLLIEPGTDFNPPSRFSLHNLGISPMEWFYPQFRFPARYSKAKAEEPIEILKRLNSERGRLVLPTHFSSAFASRFYQNDYDKGLSDFHLVIGNTLKDRLYAWNRNLFGHTQFNGFHTAWLPDELCDDAFLDELGKYISGNFRSHGSGTFGKVVSFSRETAELETLALRLKAKLRFPIRGETLEAYSIPPGKGEYRRLYFDGINDEQSSAVTPFAERKSLIAVPKPIVAKADKQFGYWVVDLGVQYHPDRAVYNNQRPNWHLPRKPRLASYFLDQGEGLPRVSHGGWISQIVNSRTKQLTVKIPNDHAVVYGACFDFRTSNLDRLSQETPRKPKYSRFQISDEGRSLMALTNLFRGFSELSNYIEDKFWRTIFEKLAYDPAFNKEKRLERIKSTLTQFSEKNGGLPSSKEGVNALAEEMTRATRPPQGEKPSKSMSYLTNTFSRMKKSDPEGRWLHRDERFNDRKFKELAHLLAIEVLAQGVSVSCRHCNKSNWFGVKALADKLLCRACLNELDLPPNPEWHFILNDLVTKAFQTKGLRTVVGAYIKLRDFCPGMFLSYPCFDIYEDSGDSDRFTDIDIFAICNGKLIIGEAKTSASGFTDKLFKKLSEIADQIRPDEIVLATSSTEIPETQSKRIEAFRNSMSKLDIEVRVLTVDWN